MLNSLNVTLHFVLAFGKNCFLLQVLLQHSQEFGGSLKSEWKTCLINIMSLIKEVLNLVTNCMFECQCIQGKGRDDIGF